MERKDDKSFKRDIIVSISFPIFFCFNFFSGKYWKRNVASGIPNILVPGHCLSFYYWPNFLSKGNFALQLVNDSVGKHGIRLKFSALPFIYKHQNGKSKGKHREVIFMTSLKYTLRLIQIVSAV